MSPTVDLASLIDTNAMRRFHKVIYDDLVWPDGAQLAVTSLAADGNRGARTKRASVHDVDRFVALATEIVAAGRQAYVNVAPQQPGLDISARGKKDVSYGVPALVADVDCQGGAHKLADKPGDLPLPTEAEALELIKAFPLTVTLLIHTGGGFHVWCCLEEPLDWRSEAGAEALRRWKAALLHLFEVEAGRRFDKTVPADPARMLRIPGTANLKSGLSKPRPVRIVELADVPDRALAA